MPTTINNEATTSYQFVGSSNTGSVTSNTSSVVLLDNQGLNITKTATPTTFTPGEIVTYTISITNSTGSFLSGVRVIDNLGGGNLAYVVGSGSVTSTSTYAVSPVATNPLTFTLQQLNVGQSMTLTYRAQVIFNLPVSVSVITNNVRAIGYTSTGTVEGFASATISREVGSTISSAKSASVEEVLPRQPFSYFIRLANSTDTNATATETIDDLPNNFVLTSVELRIGSGTNQTLNATDYEVSSENVLTIPSLTGPIVTVPAGTVTVITLNGYFE